MELVASVMITCMICLTILYIINKWVEFPPKFTITLRHEYEQSTSELSQIDPDKEDLKNTSKDLVEALNEFVNGGGA